LVIFVPFFVNCFTKKWHKKSLSLS
jgi:hypothetical protein